MIWMLVRWTLWVGLCTGLAGCRTEKNASPVVILELPAEAVIGERLEEPDPVDFVTEVQPLLETRCLKCHQRGYGLMSLVFHTKRDLLRGGGGRPVLVPGAPESSTLFLVTVVPEYFVEAMPPAGDGETNHKPLTAEERAVIYHWILQGAPWPEDVVLSDPASRPKVTAVASTGPLIAAHAR